MALERFAIVMVTVIAVMIPWTVRNEVVMHAFLPIGTTTGDNLCIGNYPDAQGHFAFPDGLLRRRPRRAPPGVRDAAQRQADQPVAALDRCTIRCAQLRLIPQRTYYTFKDDHDAVAAVQSYGDDPFIPPPQRHACCPNWPTATTTRCWPSRCSGCRCSCGAATVAGCCCCSASWRWPSRPGRSSATLGSTCRSTCWCRSRRP